MTKIVGLIDVTQDAYSFERYGEEAWLEAIRYMKSKGLTHTQTEVMLRSKHMRWAMDVAGDKNKKQAFRKYAANMNLKAEADSMIAESGTDYCYFK